MARAAEKARIPRRTFFEAIRQLRACGAVRRVRDRFYAGAYRRRRGERRATERV